MKTTLFSDFKGIFVKDKKADAFSAAGKEKIGGGIGLEKMK